MLSFLLRQTREWDMGEISGAQIPIQVWRLRLLFGAYSAYLASHDLAAMMADKSDEKRNSKFQVHSRVI